MKCSAGRYSFEMPDKWKDMVGVRRKGVRTDLFLLWEEEPGCSGLLASLRCRKGKRSVPGEDAELLGALLGGDGDVRYLYAVYGREGSVSEANEDLYWRLRDRLWQVFESIRPAEGYLWRSGQDPDPERKG